MKTVKAILFYTPGSKRLYRNLHWLLNALALLTWSAGLGVVSLFFAKGRYAGVTFLSYFHNPLIILLNLLPVLLITLLAYFISNRVWISILSSGLIVIIPTFINNAKLVLRNDPLLATDVRYISEAANISGNYSIPVNAYMIVTVVFIIAAVVMSFFLLRARVSRGLVRVIGAVLVAAVGCTCYLTLYRSDAIYQKTENLHGRMSYWSDTDQYICRGFIYPLIYSTKELSDNRPEGYDTEESAALLASYPEGGLTDGEKINIIGVMFEAYNDFSKFGAVSFTDDPYAFLHELQAESAYGELVTNIFAGGTIDTERAFLTGTTELFEYRSPVYSLARWFDEQGYRTEFCHAGYEWFYNRRNVAEYMGFESAHFFEDRYTLPEGWGLIHDDEFLPDLVTLLEDSVESGEPYFNFSVTYQNHGPYSDSELEREKTYVAEGSVSERAWYILNNYFAGVAETDEALRGVVDSLRAMDEPVVLVIFGDHNPWLGDSAWVYEELGISFDGELGFYDYYCTPWVIWANDAARAVIGGSYTTGDKGSFSPCFLSAELFDLLGWEGSAQINALRDLRSYADVIHATGMVRENGALTSTPTAETAEKISGYKKLEYYLRKDALD